MSPVPMVDVYSTFARDILIREGTNQRREQPGGPAFYIQTALHATSVPFVMRAGSVVDVEILITDSGELGSVRPTFPPDETPASASGRAIVSTLFREWDPRVIASSCEELYVDVQGFVREAGSFGKKQSWEEFQGEWIQKVAILKATEEELRYLPPASVEDQKTRVLLVTRGRDGVVAYVAGRRIEFAPTRVVESTNTIGAGDTFFATVVGNVALGVPMEESVRLGMEAAATLIEKIN